MKLATANINLPAGKQDAILFDETLTGFGLRLRRGRGGKVIRNWIVQYRSHGRSRRMRVGSLVAYGPDYLHMYRRAPFYVDRVLKGANPADLPVEQPAKVELLVNLQTAKMLGVEVPLSLLIRADELLE